MKEFSDQEEVLNLKHSNQARKMKVLSIVLAIIIVIIAIPLLVPKNDESDSNSNIDAQRNSKPITNNVDDSKLKEEQIIEKNKTTPESFQSNRYDVKFTYPKEFGKVKVGFNPEYFNNESVSFENAKFTMSYPRFEGAFGEGTKYSYKTMDGKNIDLYVFPQGVNNEYYGVFAQSASIDGATITFIAQELKSMDEVNVMKAQVETVIKSLSFDLRFKDFGEEVVVEEPQSETETFQSTRYNVKFTYPKEFGEIMLNYSPEYFNNESIRFENGKFAISYPVFEGGFGEGTKYTYKTKDGKNIDLFVSPQGVNKENYGILAKSDSVNGGSVIFSSQGLTSLEEVEAAKSQIIAVIESMSFDF